MSQMAAANKTQYGGGGDYDYRTLKKEKSSLTQRMSPSLSQTRLLREFTPKQQESLPAPILPQNDAASRQNDRPTAVKGKKDNTQTSAGTVKSEE